MVLSPAFRLAQGIGALPGTPLAAPQQGGPGDDTLTAAPGGDTLDGLAGHDTVLGGAGADHLQGGGGADRFEFWRGFGRDRIEDFHAAEGDVIALGAGMWAATQGPLTAAQGVQTFGRITAGGNAVLEFAGAGTTVAVGGWARWTGWRTAS